MGEEHPRKLSRQHFEAEHPRHISLLESPQCEMSKLYFSKEEIERFSPSRKDGIDLVKESFLRSSYCTFLQRLGMKLHVSSNLRSLKLVLCDRLTSEGIMEAVVKLPLLEDLEVSYCTFSAESLKVLGQSCPNLKTLKKNVVGFRRPTWESDDDALAISETMPGLGYLQLFGNRLTNNGLNAILDNCPNLEHL